MSLRVNTEKVDGQIADLTEVLDKAKADNDASGIASAANKISQLNETKASFEESQTKYKKELADLTQKKADADKLGTIEGKEGPGLIIAADGKDLVFAYGTKANRRNQSSRQTKSNKSVKSGVTVMRWRCF